MMSPQLFVFEFVTVTEQPKICRLSYQLMLQTLVVDKILSVVEITRCCLCPNIYTTIPLKKIVVHESINHQN